MSTTEQLSKLGVINRIWINKNMIFNTAKAYRFIIIFCYLLLFLKTNIVIFFSLKLPVI